MPTKRTLSRQLADARAQIRDLVDERDEAREALKSRERVEEHLATSRPDVVAQLTRERDQAERELAAAGKVVIALRQQLAGRPTSSAELRDARRVLMLAERARRTLADQLAVVQAANDAMRRERVDAAGTLARREVTA